MSDHPLDIVGAAYEEERALWGLRRDKASGMHQIVRLQLGVEPDEANPDVLAQLSDKDAADTIMRRMRRNASADAAIKALKAAGYELP